MCRDATTFDSMPASLSDHLMGGIACFSDAVRADPSISSTRRRRAERSFYTAFGELPRRCHETLHALITTRKE